MNSRRNFLKKATAAGLATAAGPALFAGSAAASTQKNDKSTDGLVFLFQGDSITDGNRGRNNDPNHIMGHGYAFSIASRVGADFAEKKLQFYNRGISGHKVTDLTQRWQSDTLDLRPNVLSVLVGINDVDSFIGGNTENTVDVFLQTYRSLLNQAKAQNSNVLFVLCQPFVLPVGRVGQQWEQYRAEVASRQAIVATLANEFNAVLVDSQKVMDGACKRAPADYWMWDGIHPTVAGHELLAREWIRATAKRLDFLLKYRY